MIVRIFKNFISMLMGNISGKIIGLLAAIILARYLGPEEYGQYSFVISLAYIFLVCSELGMNELIVKRVAANHAIGAKLFSNLMVIRGILSIINITIMILFVYVLGYSWNILVCTIIFSFHLFFLAIINEINSFFTAFERMEFVGGMLIINGIIGLGLITLIVVLKGSLLMIITSRVATYIFGSLIGFYLLNKFLFKVEYFLEIAKVKEIIKEAIPFFIINVTQTLYYKIDIILLSKLKGDIFVGWYSIVSNDIFFGFYAIVVSFSVVMFPIYVKNYSESIENIQRSCNFTIRIGLVLGMALGCGAFILAPEIITIILGERYGNSVIVMKILSISILFLFLREPLGFALVAAGGVKKIMRINIIILLLNGILNYFFISLWGHVGAAITMTVCGSISFLWIYFEVKKKLGEMNILQPTLKLLIGATVMVIIIGYFSKKNIIAGIVIGAAVYLGNIFIMKIVYIQEMDKLWKIVMRK